MKSYNHIYETLVSEKVRMVAIHKASLGHKHLKGFDKYCCDEERALKDSLAWLNNFKNDSHKPITIYDGVSRKQRKIIVPTYKELVVQHCVVTSLMPIFMRGMYEHSYSSIPDRGIHKAKKHIEKWIKHDKKNCKYVLKMDIRHFFDTIPHDIIKRMLKEKIHDKKMLEILVEIINVTDIGLPLGFYTSQWLANWYLQGLDHYIKENLKAVHYVRYADDMVIFGSSKRKLHEMQRAISEYLTERLGLKMKDNWQVFRFVYDKGDKTYGRDLDFLGFRFYRNKTIIRKSIMLKSTRKALKMGKKEKPTIFDIRQMLSYLGWFKYTDSYNSYTKWIKPFIDVKKCKRRISNHDTRMVRGRRLVA